MVTKNFYFVYGEVGILIRANGCIGKTPHPAFWIPLFASQIAFGLRVG